MTRQRRGSGGHGRPSSSSPLDLSTTLGSLLRSTLEQVSVVGEAALERARGSRERVGGSVDRVLVERKRRDALARLGGAVYLMAVRGELDQVGESTEIARMLAQIEDLDDALESDPPRPARPTGGPRAARQARDEDAEDGVVSSADWQPPARPRGERMRVWRPSMTAHAPEPQAAPGSRPRQPGYRPDAPQEDAPAGRERARRRARMHDPEPRAGGIVFVGDPVADDDDLAGYMHDDDVEDRGS